jgi:hypothetical protein
MLISGFAEPPSQSGAPARFAKVIGKLRNTVDELENPHTQ